MKGFKQGTKMSHTGHYCWGGKVMKKADGGKISLSAPAMRGTGGPDPFVGGGNPNVRNPPALGNPSMRGQPVRMPMEEPTRTGGLEQMPTRGSFGLKPVRDYNPRRQDDALRKFARDVDKGRLPPEGNPMAPGNRLKKGGKVNWIQGAIKKPGALHKQLGVPEGEKIPAGKLEKASKAGGKLGQRARMAMTLKGMK